MPHVLIVDDEPDVRSTLAEMVEEFGFTAAQAGSLREATIQLQRQRPDVVLMDIRLPEGNGMALCDSLDLKGAEVVFVTGYASMETAIEALRYGAFDYLVKPVSLQQIGKLLGRVKGKGPLASGGSGDPFERILGDSPSMKALCDHIRKVGPTDATVLLVGESGTGKELAAEAVHRCSRRHKGPFLPINCGAISPNLIESELFGHERGSFTGADRQHKGYFERADGGTLFLDEITEMPLDLQVRLLRVLETGLFMRVGTHAEIATNVRLVAATNRDPEEAVATGKLREDLYHRLSVFPLQLPPLRERGDDACLIAHHLLDNLNAEENSRKTFSPEALQAIRDHHWPGNVRELRNYVHRAYILADEVIGGDISPLPASIENPSANGAQVAVPVGVSLADADRRLIFATLEQCGGVKKQAAAILGISLKTLYNRLEEYAAAGHLPRSGSASGSEAAANR